VWLPNVGYGELTQQMDAYFRDNLKRLTGRDFDKAIVIYCVLDCWMSWNAVQRAAGYGYRNIYWYRGGSDDWREQGLELVEGEPVPPVREDNR
jgi:PQQ-dependent catabolism-associated CXXCW motif protein